MSDDDPDNESFEEKVRAIAREVSRSVERLADFNMDEIADAIGVDAERAKQLADTAARWLNSQAETLGGEGPLWSGRAGRPAADHDPRGPGADDDPRGATAADEPRRASSRRASGPHPLDLPTSEQGIALSALDSGRWTVEPGSNSFTTHDEGSTASDALGLVGELRARDWIDAHGEVTLVGRNALRRWLDSANAD